MVRPANWGIGLRLVVCAALGALLGLAFALTIPRGPMTTAQSLAALAMSAVVGVLAGWVLGNRWAALLTPAALAVVFEVGRVGTDGPTVDGISLDGIYPIMAFVAGRGFDALVILVPMAVGALWGAALARRQLDGSPRRRGRAWRVVRTVCLGVATAAIVMFVVGLARPASTEPFVDADGQPVPGSIAELTTVDIGGHEQAIQLRGRSADAPVLLFLEGGPGGTAVGSMHFAGAPLEQRFVVATWDQRGTGKSAPALEPVETMTVEQAVSDAIDVTEYLRDRFGEPRIYLVGSSWGTTLGTLVVQQRPDLFHAYVGSGQMVSQRATDELMYAESLAYARRVGDAAFEARLVDNGPPPYTDMLDYPVAISSNPDWEDFPHGADFDLSSTYPANLLAPEYSLTESVRSLGGLMETFAVMYPQLQEVDFRRDVPQLDVPVYVVEGQYEAPGRATLAEEWFAGLAAPAKQYVVFENSGHTPHLHEPARFAALMSDIVRDTYPK